MEQVIKPHWQKKAEYCVYLRLERRYDIRFQNKTTEDRRKVKVKKCLKKYIELGREAHISIDISEKYIRYGKNRTQQMSVKQSWRSGPRKKRVQKEIEQDEDRSRTHKHTHTHTLCLEL